MRDIMTHNPDWEENKKESGSDIISVRTPYVISFWTTYVSASTDKFWKREPNLVHHGNHKVPADEKIFFVKRTVVKSTLVWYAQWYRKSLVSAKRRLSNTVLNHQQENPSKLKALELSLQLIWKKIFIVVEVADVWYSLLPCMCCNNLQQGATKNLCWWFLPCGIHRDISIKR